LSLHAVNLKGSVNKPILNSCTA